SKRAQLQRDTDVAKTERQAREADALKTREQQQRDDMNAKEIRIQNVYDTFMKEMSSIVLKNNISLTILEIAKTLMTLEQIYPKRKWYLIKFLYDSQLLYTKNLGKRMIDVKFGGDMKFARRIDLYSIRLLKAELKNSLFENVGLSQANFEFSDLNSSTFIAVSMTGASFKDALLENSKFVRFIFRIHRSKIQNSNCHRGHQHQQQNCWCLTTLTVRIVI
ncbi:unnamed protein product, partial [Didymodactylos carnosus]